MELTRHSDRHRLIAPPDGKNPFAQFEQTFSLPAGLLGSGIVFPCSVALLLPLRGQFLAKLVTFGGARSSEYRQISIRNKPGKSIPSTIYRINCKHPVLNRFDTI